jgi:hypothetical protein
MEEIKLILIATLFKIRIIIILIYLLLNKNILLLDKLILKISIVVNKLCENKYLFH